MATVVVGEQEKEEVEEMNREEEDEAEAEVVAEAKAEAEAEDVDEAYLNSPSRLCSAQDSISHTRLPQRKNTPSRGWRRGGGGDPSPPSTSCVVVFSSPVVSLLFEMWSKKEQKIPETSSVASLDDAKGIRGGGDKGQSRHLAPQGVALLRPGLDSDFARSLARPARVESLLGRAYRRLELDVRSCLNLCERRSDVSHHTKSATPSRRRMEQQ